MLTAVIQTIYQHQNHNGILLRATDLIAFHLNQQSGTPSSNTFHAAVQAVITVADNLCTTHQGACAALLALVAYVRHRKQRHVVDSKLANIVVGSMQRHAKIASVQILACEIIRVATNGNSNHAKMAAREFFNAGALHALLAAIRVNTGAASTTASGDGASYDSGGGTSAGASDAVSTSVDTVERAILALTSLLTLGNQGSDATTLKPTIPLTCNQAHLATSSLQHAAIAMFATNHILATHARTVATNLSTAAAQISSSSISSQSNTPKSIHINMNNANDNTQYNTNNTWSFSMLALGRKLVSSLRKKSVKIRSYRFP